MTELSEEISDSQLEAFLGAQEPRDVVLLFWAPWHRRSLEIKAELAHLASQHGEEMLLLSLNTDRHIDLAMRHGMRAVPLIVLRRQGKEVARTSGLNGCDGLLTWLWRHGALSASMPAQCELGSPSLKGAFHGDAALRARLITQLQEYAHSGSIVSQRVPFWCDGVGTISGALAQSLRPDVVEERSGLPFSFVCVLEFLCQEWSEATIGNIFTQIPVGADLSMLATSLLREVFGDPGIDWASLIDDERIDRLRQQWLRLIDRHVCALAVTQAEWDEIVVGLGVLRSQGRDPSRAVQDAFIDILGILSPPPAHDDDLWVNAISLHGIYLLHVIVGHDLGWTREDFGFEGVRAHWFMEREKRQAGGSFSDATLRTAQQQWMIEHGEAQRHYDQLLHESSENLPLLCHRICQRLLALLRESAPQLADQAQ